MQRANYGSKVVDEGLARPDDEPEAQSKPPHGVVREEASGFGIQQQGFLEDGIVVVLVIFGRVEDGGIICVLDIGRGAVPRPRAQPAEDVRIMIGMLSSETVVDKGSWRC